MNTIDFNKLRADVAQHGGGHLVDELRRVQQAQYKREDLPLLEALGLANAFLSAQYNVDEEVK
jgi:hypothetical protein